MVASAKGFPVFVVRNSFTSPFLPAQPVWGTKRPENESKNGNIKIKIIIIKISCVNIFQIYFIKDHNSNV